MTVKINKSTAFGRISAPPSKSMAHRYLICGALSGGSVIKGIDYS
ncbi:MAG: 3-phosphoshikimate 1-carboxyvinyltransferase, partial [Acutalibacteraceae bacterium]|nr:3-phosphoshikimate 1-carboxyvinyltransferase [Acutalibacteraceae bacterium]